MKVKDDTGLLLIWTEPEDELDVRAVEVHAPKVIVALTGYVLLKGTNDALRFRNQQQADADADDAGDDDRLMYELSLLVRHDFEVKPELLDRIPEGSATLPDSIRIQTQ
jgi:hypothetical protein